MSRVPYRQEMSLWIQLLAGPVLWSVYFLISYMFVETFCQTGWKFSLLGLNGIPFLVIALTTLAVLGTGLFAFKSYRNWRSRNSDRGLRDHVRETTRWFESPVDFMYFSGFLLSLLFAVVILITGIPALFLQPC